MNSRILKRIPPAHVTRQLRQEAYFGCAKCGNPILEYHHIIPWHEINHHDPEHMIALCPTHHHEIEKLPRASAYKVKQNPFNGLEKRFRGFLGTDKEKPTFVFGSNISLSKPNVLVIFQVPFVRYRIADGQSLVSIFIPRSDFWPEVEIVDNDVVATVSDFWDIEFSTNYLRFRKRKGHNFFCVDLRQEHAEISGDLLIGPDRLLISPSKFSFQGVTLSHCKSGGPISFESNVRLLRPNFAMTRPQAKFFFNPLSEIDEGAIFGSA